MFARPKLLNDETQPVSRLNLPPSCAERQLPREESRVSTDSDLDLESEEDEDDYRSTFSDVLMRRLVAVERAQQRQTQEGLLRCSPPLQLLAAATEDSYWAKMRRVSQWRQSTLQSETQSENQSETSSYYSPPAPSSRKRSLSDASLPSDPKRTRLSGFFPAPPTLPLVSHPRAYPLESSKDVLAEMGAYPRTYMTELRAQPYPNLGALHVCSACDTSFASRQRLRRHGRGAWTPDACRAAVTYGLE